MIHAFDGELRSQRPLQDLATTFELTGFDLQIARGALRSGEMGLTVDATSSPSEGVALVGKIDDACLDPDDVLRRLALAMEADGIAFTLRLLNADGVARVTYESDR
jgi:hypothetical protein